MEPRGVGARRPSSDRNGVHRAEASQIAASDVGHVRWKRNPCASVSRTHTLSLCILVVPAEAVAADLYRLTYGIPRILEPIGAWHPPATPRCRRSPQGLEHGRREIEHDTGYAPSICYARISPLRATKPHHRAGQATVTAALARSPHDLLGSAVRRAQCHPCQTHPRRRQLLSTPLLSVPEILTLPFSEILAPLL